MGFGHRVYKSYDPRARIVKQVADEVFEVTGKNPLLEIAQELERIALQDDYFVKRKLYPNVDFYSGLIYEAMGIPVDMFTVLFAIPRTSGWLAQWEEMLLDPETKITRPRQVYDGPDVRDYVPVGRARLTSARTVMRVSRRPLGSHGSPVAARLRSQCGVGRAARRARCQPRRVRFGASLRASSRARGHRPTPAGIGRHPAGPRLHHDAAEDISACRPPSSRSTRRRRSAR